LIDNNHVRLAVIVKRGKPADLPVEQWTGMAL
jgi:hypothetical protein